MVFNKRKHIFYVALRVLFLFVTLLVLSYFLLRRQWWPAVLSLIFVIWAVSYFIRYTYKVNKEVEEFLEALHYGDYNRKYALKKSSTDVRFLRYGFNEINNAFRKKNIDNEIFLQYYQRMLELMDTGLLSYEIESGAIIWMNRALKNMFDFPSFKNIRQAAARQVQLFECLEGLKTGESEVFSLQKGPILKILLNATVFETNGIKYKLVSFQNVNEALEETEELAWQKLLSVMTHEIMNSVAPIASLADTLENRLQQKDKNELLEDLEQGIGTIKRRSEGLTKFAETYRNLSKISRLEKTVFLVRDLLENIFQLMEPTLKQKNINLEIVLQEPGMKIEADQNLIEQVLINLILNAMEALKGRHHPSITLSNGHENNRPFIRAADNGNGIAPDLLDKIFIPFFSTKKNGNGIGLSICKNIMRMHGGSLSVRSKPDIYTSFTLAF